LSAPFSGIAAKLSNDRLRLSEWAEQYERERGQIFCDRRVENNERRKAQYVKDRESQQAAEYHRWRREQTSQAVKRREQQTKNLSAAQKKQQQSLSDAKEQRIADRSAELREKNRPEWAALYRRQERQLRDFTKRQNTAWGRVRHYLKNRERWTAAGTRKSLPGVVAGAFQSIASDKNATRTFEQKQLRQRKALADRVNRQTRQTVKEINAQYTAERDQLIAQQQKDRALTKAAQSKESQQAAREVASGKKRAEFDRLTSYKIPALDTEAERKPTKPAKDKTPYRAFRDMEADQKAKAKAAKRSAVRDALDKTKDEITRDTAAEARTAKRQQLKDQLEKTKEDITRDVAADGKAEKDKKRKDTYSAFRELREETTRPKEQKTKDKDKDKGKAKSGSSYRAFRDMQEDREQDRGRDADRGRERDADKPHPPKPKR